MRKLLFTALAMLSLTAAAGPYKFAFPMPQNTPDSIKAYLCNSDTGEKIDSTYTVKQTVTFSGTIDEPVPACIRAGNKSYGNFVLEDGSFTFNNNGTASGSMLNDILVSEYNALEPLFKEISSVTTEEEYYQKLPAVVKALSESVVRNVDTPVGYLLFLELQPALDGKEIIDFVNANPSLKSYTRVSKAYNTAQNRIATSEGKPFRDFTVTHNGVSKSLSDYVGKGQYVLVDFWASWCGPCRREMPVLKEIYDTYAPKGLKVLGVAVWDKPEDSEEAIKSLGLPWECIINAQRIPTDIYGISGIPSIIIFAPDGTIYSRDARGEELKAIVAKIYENK